MGVNAWHFEFEHNIVGIRYFEKNSLLLDFETKGIGWRLGY
ncbi:hypothetical protein ACVDG5_005090 [Mesorhizobium sp. ORM6]